MFKKRLLLIIIFSMFVVSFITMIMILNYLDPYPNTIISIILLSFTFILSVSCFSAILLYLIKKIHFRGDVNVSHVLISFRQGFFISLFFICLVIFNKLGAPLFITGSLLCIMFVFFDLFLKNIKS